VRAGQRRREMWGEQSRDLPLSRSTPGTQGIIWRRMSWIDESRHANPAYFSFPKDVASSTAVSVDFTKTGIFLSSTLVSDRFLEADKNTNRQPGLFRILETCLMVSSRTFFGVISICQPCQGCTRKDRGRPAMYLRDTHDHGNAQRQRDR
jgi:hypothetical protein